MMLLEDAFKRLEWEIMMWAARNNIPPAPLTAATLRSETADETPAEADEGQQAGKDKVSEK